MMNEKELNNFVAIELDIALKSYTRRHNISYKNINYVNLLWQISMLRVEVAHCSSSETDQQTIYYNVMIFALRKRFQWKSFQIDE